MIDEMIEKTKLQFDNMFVDDIPCGKHGRGCECYFGMHEKCGAYPCLFATFRKEKHSTDKDNGHDETNTQNIDEEDDE